MLPTITTTRHGDAPLPAKKPFAWSYSKLKNYEKCPKRHYHYDVARDVKEPESEELKQGNLQHKYLADAIGFGKPIPDAYRPFLEPWTKRIFNWKGVDVRDRGAEVKVEQELAIDANFAPCEWFGKTAWYRAKADAMWLFGPLGAVFDWKTGKVDPDSVQLVLTAICMFSHYPQLQVVRSQFVWLAHDTDSTMDIKRSEVPALWGSLWPRIEELRKAHETTNYPPTPNRLCARWCAVKQCPYHGERHG